MSFAGDRGVITLGVTLGRTGHAPIPIQVHRRTFSHLVMGPALAMGVAGLAVGWAEVHHASTGTLMLATFFADTTRHVRGVGAVLEVAFKGRVRAAALTGTLLLTAVVAQWSSTCQA